MTVSLDQPITRYQDDPRWQALDAEHSKLVKGRRGTAQRQAELNWEKRAIERIYEQLDARKALIARILFDHPAGSSLSSTDAEALAETIALKLI